MEDQVCLKQSEFRFAGADGDGLLGGGGGRHFEGAKKAYAENQLVKNASKCVRLYELCQIPNSRGKSREEAKVDLENSDHGTRADQVNSSFATTFKYIQ